MAIMSSRKTGMFFTNNTTILETLNNNIAAFMLRTTLKREIIIISLFYSIFFVSSAVAEFNAQEVTAVEAAQILKNNPDIKILDVRTGFEYRRGHLKEAINLNYYLFSFKANLEKLDKNSTWLVHCHSGVRSGKTLPLMKEAGFNNIIHLSKGIVDWNEAGLPLAK